MLRKSLLLLSLLITVQLKSYDIYTLIKEGYSILEQYPEFVVPVVALFCVKVISDKITSSNKTMRRNKAYNNLTLFESPKSNGETKLQRSQSLPDY